MVKYILLPSNRGQTRKCRNWQTSKTKDLVTARSCGFKSHLPQASEECESSEEPGKPFRRISGFCFWDGLEDLCIFCRQFAYNLLTKRRTPGMPLRFRLRPSSPVFPAFLSKYTDCASENCTALQLRSRARNAIIHLFRHIQSGKTLFPAEIFSNLLEKEKRAC